MLSVWSSPRRQRNLNFRLRRVKIKVMIYSFNMLWKYGFSIIPLLFDCSIVQRKLRFATVSLSLRRGIGSQISCSRLMENVEQLAHAEHSWPPFINDSCAVIIKGDNARESDLIKTKLLDNIVSCDSGETSYEPRLSARLRCFWKCGGSRDRKFEWLVICYKKI